MSVKLIFSDVITITFAPAGRVSFVGSINQPQDVNIVAFKAVEAAVL
ncbi:MAG: hypothetical protein R2836_05880 [Chitinophagales bacterium]